MHAYFAGRRVVYIHHRYRNSVFIRMYYIFMMYNFMEWQNFKNLQKLIITNNGV